MSGNGENKGAAGEEDPNTITLKISGDERFIKADKGVLARNSKYFKAAISFGEKEITFDPAIVTYPALKDLVESMVTKRINPPPITKWTDLARAADYLQMKTNLVPFIYKSLKHIKQLPRVSKQDLMELLRLYPLVRDHERDATCQKTEFFLNELNGVPIPSSIRKVSLTFILAVNFKCIMFELPVLRLDEDLLVQLLSSNDLDISENEVLRVIKTWIIHDLVARRDSFPKLLRCVRPDPLSVTTILEEMTCYCAPGCDCLTSKDSALAFIAFKECGVTNGCFGPLNSSKRPRLTYF